MKLKINIEDIYSDSKFDQYNEEIFEEYLDNAEEIITDFVEINFDYKKRFSYNNFHHSVHRLFVYALFWI